MNKRDQVINKLRAQSFKITPQRLAVIEYLKKHPTHPTAEEIYKSIKKKYPTISFATVYNTLDKLEEIQELNKLKVSDGMAINIEFNQAPHDHFFCINCRQIFDVTADPKPCLKIERHEIHSKHVCYKGICYACATKKERS